MIEKDPNGYSPKEPGAKLDQGKPPITRGLLQYFPRACRAVAEVSAKGAEKYSWKGWESVPDAYNRYSDALGRHMLDKEIQGSKDKDTGLYHDAQIAWNALAVLEIFLRNLENESSKSNGCMSTGILGGGVLEQTKDAWAGAAQQSQNPQWQQHQNIYPGYVYDPDCIQHQGLTGVVHGSSGRTATDSACGSGNYQPPKDLKPSWMELQEALEQWTNTQRLKTCRT